MLLAHSGVVERLVELSTGSFILVSFIAGFFYSSLFTVAPATVALFELAEAGAPIHILAIFGGLGGMIADIGLFEIIKFSFIDDITAYFQKISRGHFAPVFRLNFFRLLMVGLGTLIIATPIPDEVGLAMMGIGKANVAMVSILTFMLNVLGIAVLGLIAQAA